MIVTYTIEVDGGRATIKTDPSPFRLKKGQDISIQFTSTDENTVLRFGDKSPFDMTKIPLVSTDVPGEKVLPVGKKIVGPFPVVNFVNADGDFLIGCGFIEKRTKGFANWGGHGPDIPPDDGNPH